MTQAAAAKPIPWPAMSVQQAYALITQPGTPGEMEEVEIRGVKTRVWKNAPPTLRETLLMGRSHGDKIFMVHEDERVSFEAFYRAVTHMAAELQAFGVQKGDRVAIVMRNVPEWPVAFYAGLSLGAIVTPLNAWWTGPELEYGLVDSGAKVAIVDVERYERLAEHLHNCPELQRVYVSRSPEEISHPYVVHLEAVIGGANDWAALEAKPLPAGELTADDDATIFYTSGTTGKPKGAIATHRNINSNIFAAAAASARAFLRRGEAPPQPDPSAPQKGALLSVPFFHATGCFAVLNPSLFAGAKLVMMRKWDPERAMQVIQDERL